MPRSRGSVASFTALCLVGFIAMAVCACAQASTSTSGTRLSGPPMTAAASWDPDYLTIEKQMELSGIVVAGTVVKIDAPRCNSPDGKEWSPPEDQTLPIVYTTFYVEPAQILKGTPEWGTPVAFRVTGNTQEWDLQLSVGER